MTPSLNADVLRLIIREAALEAETCFSHSIIDAFYQRSTTLRRFSLVNSQWRSLAQLELESYVVLTNRNQVLLHGAIVKTGLAKRVRRLVDRRGTGIKDERLFSQILEKCEGLRELDCANSRFALSSLWRAKDLESLSLSSVSLVNVKESTNLVLPFRLRSFSLSGSCTISKTDWRALQQAGAGNLERLSLAGRLSSNPASLINTLSSWLPSVRNLDLAEIDPPTPLIPSLHYCQKLERLSIKLSDFPSTLAVLGCSPQHLEVVASSDTLDFWTWEDYQSNVLSAIGKAPLDKVETVKIFRSPGIDETQRDVALSVKIGKRRVGSNRRNCKLAML